MAPHPALLPAFLVCGLMAAPAFAQPEQSSGNGRIITQARADLTPAGAEWAKQESQRILGGQVQPFEVAKDAALVKDGVVAGGSPDELVLIALIEAKNAKGGAAGPLPQSPQPPAAGERATRPATLDQSIANVIQTLMDTQHPAPREKLSRAP
jgi:hypothetical protein